MLSIKYLFEDEDIVTREEMEQCFENRINYHIALVNKYLQKIIDLNDERIENNILEQEKDNHDESKFIAPEYEPYLYINWKYYVKDKGLNFTPGKKIEKEMQAATFHHVKNNKHHPEAWDENATIESINSEDRDKPGKIIDATKMPLSFIAATVADWCATSEERGTSPYEWAKDNINKRWKFNKEQEDFIYELISKIW